MKKIISACLVFILIINAIVFAESGDVSYQQGYDAGYNQGYSAGYNEGSDNVYEPSVPKIIFLAQKKIPEVGAGEKLNLVIEFKNDSEYSAKNIKITPSFENVPLEYEGPVVYEYNKNLRKEKTATATFNFKIKDDTPKGIYGIKFNIEYKNSSMENHSNEQIVYFKVNKEKIKSIVTINNIVTEPANVVAGEKFVLKFNVNNIGDVSTSDTTLKLTGLASEAFMPVDGNDFSYIGTIPAKSSVTQSFNMIASKNIKKGTNTLNAKISYLNSNNEEISDEKTLYILDVLSENISDDDVTGGKPKIIIESYSTNPSSIVAGQKIAFSFKFKNTSKSKSIGNMKITISSEDGAFMIANGSNTFYVENLLPQASATKLIELNVKQDLTSKSYPINISFDYEDANNNAYQSNEIINIPVVEYSNLVINGVYAGEGMLNQQTTLSFDYINMGKAKVSNLTATVEGDYSPVQAINYIGNLEAGSSDYYDISVTPSKEGENVGILILSFEDSSGKTIEVRKDFTGYAMADFMQDEYDPGMYDPGMVEPPVEEEEPLNIWLVVGAGVGAFLVTFIITKIITTKIVRKKLEDEI